MSEKIGAPVSIQSVHVGLFNRVILNEVSVLDLKGNTLLNAKRATAKIELRSLLKEQLSLRTISLLDADIRIYKETAEGPTNLQFIIDAFAIPKKKEKSKINLRINSLILRRIHVSYDELYKEKTPNRFNTGHIELNQITTNISVKALTPDSLKLYVRALSFNEKSGFKLNKAHFAIQANRTGATIHKLDVTLPHSHIRQEKLVANYDASHGWNQLLNTLHFEGKIDNTHLASEDFQVFHPILRDLDLHSDFSASFAISPQKIKISQLKLAEASKLLKLDAQATLERNKGKITGFSAELKQIGIQSKLAQQIVRYWKPDTTINRIISKLGYIEVQGNGTHLVTNQKGHAELRLSTQGGTAEIHAQWNGPKLKSKFHLSQIELAKILSKPDIPTHISLNGKALLAFTEKQINQANAEIKFDHVTWKGYDYQNIQLNSQFSNNKLFADLESTDTHAQFKINGNLTIYDGKPSKASVIAHIMQLSPEKLGLHTPYKAANFKGILTANIDNLSKRPTGNVAIDNFTMTGSPRGDYHLNHFDVNFQSHNGAEKISIYSDFLSAIVEGTRPFKHFVEDAEEIIRRSLPGLLPEKEKQKKASQSTWYMQAQIKRNDIFDKLFHTDFNLKNDLNIRGSLDAGDGKSAIYVFTDGFNTGQQDFKESSLFLKGQGNTYECLIKSKTFLAHKNFECVADFKTSDSCLISKLDWHAETKKNYDGRFECTTQFWNNNENLDFHVKIHPSQFTLADSIWQISSGEIAMTQRELWVKHFGISHADQALQINGGLSPYRNDSIIAFLNKIDIEYILGLVDFDAVDFGGKASGQVILDNTTESPQVHALLDVPDFTFNHGNMGKTRIYGNWNKTENRINLDAQMDLPQGNGAGTKVNGYVSLAEKGLDLHIHANQTDIRFLRRYMDGIFDDFGGNATGYVNLYGPFKKLDFKGELTANAAARIVSTGVKYKVTDGLVKLSPGEFAFQNFTVKDYFNGTGKADGYLRHQHLKNLTYKFDITANHLLCYDMPQSDDLPFYSTATGSGEVQLQGMPGLFIGNIALSPESPTKLVYTQGTPDAMSADDQMIRFHCAQDDRKSTTIPDSLLHNKELPTVEERKQQEATTNIILNFLIDTNPSAELKIITDPRSGDAITAYGRGPIRAKFNNKGSFEMYGTYRLDRGTYKLSLQDVIRKDLKLRNDSKLTFSGNPQLAELGLNAIYSLNGVSLSDLNYTAGFSDKSVNVDCILNIRGTAAAPKVNFDLDLHNISEDEKQMVRQLIATEEDMNRQVIYLLGIGRFYATNPQIASGSGVQDPSAAAMKSFLSTTITSQLNSAISSAMGNESHWSFGTNVAPGVLGWEDVEVDGLLQGRLLNDRLLINGNFGYRDRPTYTSNFVGDFDIKYILTPKGGVSLKAYSETTDRYFTKSSLTTQGVGINLQRDFKNFKDLFPFKKRKKKKSTEEVETHKE